LSAFQREFAGQQLETTEVEPARKEGLV